MVVAAAGLARPNKRERNLTETATRVGNLEMKFDSNPNQREFTVELARRDAVVRQIHHEVDRVFS